MAPEDEPSPEKPSGVTRSGSSGPTPVWMLTLQLTGLWVEILASIGVLGLIGWGLDTWLGTFPWLLISGLGVGAFAGVYNAARKANRMLGGRTDERSQTK